MVIAFANNQTLVAIQTTATVVYTDPVPLNGNDRASCISDLHHLYATAGTPRLKYQGQVSNDGGVNWVDISSCTDTLTAAGVRKIVATVNGALLRFAFTLDWSAGGGATDTAGCCFDLHVNLDHV